jgi:hypothetical protein
MNTLISRILGWSFLALSVVLLLTGCLGLPSFTQQNVPRQAVVGSVSVSVEVDPHQTQVQEVTFSYGQGNGANSQQVALNCTPMNSGAHLLCQKNIPFNTTGVYSYFFETNGRVFGDITTVSTQTGRITITDPQPDNPPNGPPHPIELAAPVLLTPERGATCAGTLGGSQTTVFFDWEDVPGTETEPGAYQIEIHRVSSNCQPVDWTGVNSGMDDFPNCWIADQTQSGHSENLDQSTQYEWRVRASRINGNETTSGPFSEFQTFTTAGSPTQPPHIISPTQGQVIHLGENVVASEIQAEWSQARCLPESFHLEVKRAGTNGPETAIDGVGHSSSVSVHTNQQYQLLLQQMTNTGNAPLATVDFSTRP